MRASVLGLVLSVLAVQPAAADFNDAIDNAITGYIRPATTQFAKSAANLPGAVSALCEAGTELQTAAFEKAFSDTVRDFSRVQFLRFGPLLDDDRLSRLSFRPDPRGRGQRQIRKLYASKDPSVLSAQSLGKKSVAVQSLTALELIAFDKNTDVVLGRSGENTNYTCGYALAIAGNVAQIAEATAAAWADPDGYSQLLLSAGPENARYRTATEAMEVIYNSLATGITITKDQDIIPALGKSEDKAKPRRFPFSRSGNSVIYLAGELFGVRDALFSMDLKPLMSSEDHWTLDTLGFEFTNAGNYLEALETPLRGTFANTGNYNRVAALSITLSSIQELMSDGVAGALGLAGGFNALDGD